MRTALLYLLLPVFLLTAFGVSGQSKKTALPTAAPVWVSMMEDPNVNYFEAIKAYEDYWKTHAKPVEEEELMGEGMPMGKGDAISKEEEEREREKKKLKGAELEQREYLIYQSKRFEDWARESKPWVQENGHILSFDEREAIRLRQQEELKQQQDKK